MSRLVYSATMSLDGFIAGPGGDMSWLTEHLSGPNPEAQAVMERTGALLVGRTTFGGDDPNRGTDSEGAFGGKWHGPSIVLTHEPPAADHGDDVTFVTDLETAVATARAAAGDKDVSILGADVARQCIEAGHCDEIVVFVAPVLLGDGTPLFSVAGGRTVRLEPLAQPGTRPLSLRCRIV